VICPAFGMDMASCSSGKIMFNNKSEKYEKVRR
jgi:hypothetical protein